MLSFNEELTAGAVTAGAFRVIDAGTGTEQTPTAATARGSRVTLTLPTAVGFGDEVLVTYTPPDSGRVLDRYGNAAGGFSRRAVTNESPSPARLVTFGLEGMALRPRFNPEHGDYEAVVPHNFPEFDTIVADYLEASTFEVRKPSSDYRSDILGYQARIGSDETEVEARVTSDDGSLSKTYTVQVFRLPRITLSVDSTSISENGGVATVTATAESAVQRPVRLRVGPHLGIGTEWDDFTVSNGGRNGGILNFEQGGTASTGSVTITAVDNAWDHPDRLVRIVGMYDSLAHTLSPVVTEWHDIVITDDEGPDAGAEPVEPGPFGLTATPNDDGTVTLNWDGSDHDASDVAARWRRVGGTWSAPRVFYLPSEVNFVGTTTFTPSGGGVVGPGCAPATYEFEVKITDSSGTPPDLVRLTLPPYPLPSPLPTVSVTSTTDGYAPFQSSLDLTSENMPSWTMTRTGDVSKPLCGVRLKFAERDTDGGASTVNFAAGQRTYDFRHPAHERTGTNREFCSITAEVVGAEHYTVDALRARGTAQVKGPGTTCDDLFEATMTVGQRFNGTELGYGDFLFQYGSMTATTFMLDGTTYTVTGVVYEGSGVLVAFDKIFPESFGLRIGSARVSGFVYSLEGTFHTYTAAHADPGWSVGDTVAVELFPAPANLASSGQNAPPELPALTVRLESLPGGHDGSNPFTVRLAFSEAVATTAEAMREHVFTVTGGAVTAAARVAGRPGVWDISVRPDSRADVGLALAPATACDADGAVCTADGRALQTGFGSYIARLPLTVAASDAPAGHDGSSAFTVRLAFSEPVPTSYRTFRDHAIAVTGGTLGAVRRVDGRSDLWEAAVTPSGDAAVELALPPTQAACNAEGAVCTSDGAPLQNGVRVTVPRAALTARFESVPESHDGAAFTLRLAFSEAVATGYKKLRDKALTVANGTVTGARRVDGRSDLWSIAVQPASGKDVTVTLPATASCDGEGAVCTAAERKLTAGAVVRVRGPAALTASFAQVPESHDGSAFTLRLAFSEPVSADGAVLREHALRATGGTLSSVSRVDGRRDLWDITLDPDLVGDAGLTLAASASCGSLGAVCTPAGKALSAGASVQIVGPAPLTASFEQVPESHDGVTSFTLRAAFSDAIATGHETLRDRSFSVTGGRVVDARRVEERNDLWEIEIRPSSIAAVRVSLAAPAECMDAGAVCTANGRVLSESLQASVAGPDPSTLPALTAVFQGAPSRHDASSAFTVQLSFNAPVTATREGLRTASLTVTGGMAVSVTRVDSRNDLWTVEISPSGTGPVEVSLAAATSCDAAGAVCTSDGRALSAAASVRIAGAAGLTARKVKSPLGHGGTKVFEVTIEFSAAPAITAATMRNSVLTVTHGTVKRAQRVKRHGGSGERWKFRIKPASHLKVQVLLPATVSCSDTGAVCTSDGRMLSNEVEFDVLGPNTLSVADARVREAANATLDFTVTLSREPWSTVTVDYSTSDGTATAGSDYTAASGTLTFGTGERKKTVSVAVLDDVVDEDEETMTLTLSNVTRAYLLDGEATGTIENDDPIPQAWIARFGRTVAEQVIGAVEARLRAAPRAGVEATLAGQALPRWNAGGPDAKGTNDSGMNDSGAKNAAARAKAAREAEAQERLATFSDWLRGGRQDGQDGAASAGYRGRAVTERDLLTGTSFALAAEAAGGGLVSLWGRGAVSRFDGREGDLTLDGEVVSAMLGTDWTGGPGSRRGGRDRSGSGAGAWTAGLLVAHSRGEGGYRGAGEGTVSSTVTGLYPYGRYMVNPRVTLWGVAGYGAGTLTLTPENPETGKDDRPIRTDMALTMAAAGVRGVAVEAPADGGFELTVTSDAMAVRTSSEKTAGLAAATADVTRLRLGLEGSWRGVEAGGGELTPRLEIGVRHDGGDAETGFGLDLGGGLAWAHRKRGIAADVSGRGLLTHESRGFRDLGLSGSLAWDPGQDSGRGPKLTLTQTVGASAAGGMDALLRRETLAGLAANDNGGTGRGDELQNRRLELRLGYGFPAFGGRFSSTPEFGLGLSNGRREYSLGWRLRREMRGDIGALEFALEARRQESANDNADAEHSAGVRITARW